MSTPEHSGGAPVGPATNGGLPAAPPTDAYPPPLPPVVHVPSQVHVVQSPYSAPPGQFQGQSLYANPPGAFGSGRRANVLGIIALAVAILGFVFSCIPGWLSLGWILLPIGFILGIVSLFLRDSGKGAGIAAIIVAVVGTVVGFLVFFSVIGDAFTNAFGGEAPSAVAPGEAGGGTTGDAGSGGTGAAVGTRENPHPLGTTLQGDEWAVTINSVTFGATGAVLAENQFNDAPPEGYEYILINTTAVYSGPDSDFGWSIGVDYVTPTGETKTVADHSAVAPGGFDSSAEVYTGGTIAGNIVIAVPSATAADGVLAVKVDTFGDPAFVAVK
ncbi:hypothetical protein [Microbacterium sp. E-13]|uniref:hypothetical protein n=1 Tax=Microbacterium sp. E-13 TaxID=3404048 RepID=UPI003CF1E59E